MIGFSERLGCQTASHPFWSRDGRVLYYLATSGGDAPSDFQTIGPASYWVLRMNIGF